MHSLSFQQIAANLQRLFVFTFRETEVYHFVFPKADRHTAVHVAGKQYHCNSCQASVRISFSNTTAVHIENSRLNEQRALYQIQTIDWPDLAGGQPLVYQQPGYCAHCGAVMLQQSRDSGQLVYNLCQQIYFLDEWFAAQVRALQEAQSKLQLMLADDETIRLFVADYRQRFNALADRVQQLLADIEQPKFTAFIDKPLGQYHSLVDDIYNEYTVLFPVAETPPGFFYVKSTLDKEKIMLFLRESRITNSETLAAALE